MQLGPAAQLFAQTYKHARSPAVVGDLATNVANSMHGQLMRAHPTLLEIQLG